MKRALLFISLVALASTAIALDADTSATEREAWFAHHMAYLTRGSGRWIADNAEFRSEQEPYDAYGMEWSWGLGKKSLKGRLFALVKDKDIGTLWEFRVAWHPVDHQGLLYQFGSDGSLGVGTLEMLDAATNRSQQTFYNADGTIVRAGHEHHEVSEDELRVQSFDIADDGTWTRRRLYTWRLAVPAETTP